MLREAAEKLYKSGFRGPTSAEEPLGCTALDLQAEGSSSPHSLAQTERCVREATGRAALLIRPRSMPQHRALVACVTVRFDSEAAALEELERPTIAGLAVES